MDLTFPELCKIVAESRGLSDDFWKQDPLYIRLSESLRPGAVAETIPYVVADPLSRTPSVNIDVDKVGDALGIEFI